MGLGKNSDSLPAFIQSMMCGDFYPHRPNSVELRQTHISYVLLAGDYVYKIKKAVRFAFLDYSTLEKRRHFCHEEIRLNRRLAPSVYLGVVGIQQSGERFTLNDSPREGEQVFEYAVKMRRLPEECFLHRLIKGGKARDQDCQRIASKLADFCATAATDKALVYGASHVIRRNLEKNLQEIQSLVGQSLTAKQFSVIQNYNVNFFAEYTDLLETRAREGRVRELHGDLRAEHICLEDEPIIFDCIEFNEEFRYCDAASEIAFLSMDLDFLGASLLSEHFVESFQTLTRDTELSRLLPLYKAYRACVRGKVETLKSQEPEVPEEERAEAENRARRYFQLAYRYVSDSWAPALLIVCGLVGSGKSTVARALGDRTGYQILNSDVMRKQLAGIPPTTHLTEEYGKGLYADSFNALTYDALLKQSEACLKLNKGVIVDATFKNPAHRRQFMELAARLGVPVLFVECRANEEKTLERLKNREQRLGEVSDATAAVYLRQRQEYVPLREIPDTKRVIVGTERDPNVIADDVLDTLRRALTGSE